MTPKEKLFAISTPLFAPAAPEDGLLYKFEGFPDKEASGWKFVFTVTEQGACGYYRGIYPAMALGRLGASVQVFLETEKMSLDPFFQADVIIVQRSVNLSLLDSLNRIREITGCLVIYDLDDLLHQVPKHSPCFDLFNPQSKLGTEILSTVDTFLNESDGVILSTRELASQYQRTRSFIIPISLDHELSHRDWNSPSQSWKELAGKQGLTAGENSILIGWSGGSSHRKDLLILKEPLKKILSYRPDVFFGIQSDPHTCLEFTKDLPENQVVFLPGVSFQEYPGLLSQFDIALCPLENTAFNRSKSCLRILELGARGVPYVASHVAPFQRYHQETEGRGGFVAKFSQDWVQKTLTLIDDPVLRSEKSEFQKRFIRKHYAVSDRAFQILGMVRALKEQKASGRVFPSMTQISDTLNNIPQLPLTTPRKANCPCGSQKMYASCCLPAFG